MMSEINKEELQAAMDGTGESAPVDQEASGEELSEVEQQAIEHGWNPDGVEGKLNLSAEEFMDRQKLYDDIRGLKKQNRKLQDGIEAMKEFQTTIRKNERERVIQELKIQKKLALENENYDAVVQIDDKIAEQRVADEPVSNVAFEKWVDDNEWYHQDPEMKTYADTIGAGYYQGNSNKSVEEVYAFVSEEVKKRFPEKFGNQERSKPNPVEGAGKGRNATSKKYSAKDLPEQDRQMMKTIVRTGTMTEAEYLKEYFS